MKKRDDVVYLKDILDAIERIETYMHRIDRAKFASDSMRQDAIVRQVEIIGEAARQVSDVFKQRHPQMPWSKMIGMRNELVHAYFRVDIPTVWDTVNHDIPELKVLVSNLLKDLEG